MLSNKDKNIFFKGNISYLVNVLKNQFTKIGSLLDLVLCKSASRFRSKRNYFEWPKKRQKLNENTRPHCLGQIIVGNVLSSRLYNRVGTVNRVVSRSRRRFRVSIHVSLRERYNNVRFKCYGTVSRWVGTTMARSSSEFYGTHIPWKKILRTVTAADNHVFGYTRSNFLGAGD